jgi:hypothetical protein
MINRISSYGPAEQRGWEYSNVSKYHTQHCPVYSSLSKSSTNYVSSRKFTIYTTS